MSRRVGREAALQVLFQVDMSGVGEEEAFNHVFSEFAISQNAQLFCRELVNGTRQNIKQIDEIIKQVAKEWDLGRMANVDRNILRLGLFEIIFRSDIPNNVAVNEAIELAKIYSTEESGKFINGILGHVIENQGRYIETKPGV